MRLVEKFECIMNSLRKCCCSTFVIRQLSTIEDKCAKVSSVPSFDEQAEPLMDDKTDETVGFDTRTPAEQPSRLLILSLPLLVALTLLSLLLGALATVGIAQLHYPAAAKRVQSGSEIKVKPCGSSAAEARARGCHFDIISFSWLPNECYDAELSRSFDDESELEWFLYANRTQPLTHEEIMTGEYTGLYVNWEYHLRHCMAMWKKLHRAVLGDLGNRAIDSYIGSYEHTKHCEHMLLGAQGIAFDAINTRIDVKFPDCGI
jgi:hypothetical protein